MSDNVLIVMIISVTVIGVLFIFRKLLKEFIIKVNQWGVEARLRAKSKNQKSETGSPTSTRITNSWQIGRKQKIKVSQQGAQIEGFGQVGSESSLEVDPPSNSKQNK